MIKIGVLGGSGRMGRLIMQKIIDCPHAVLSSVGIHLQKLAIPNLSDVVVSPNLDKVFSHADIVIDFTKPEALQGHIEAAVQSQTPLVVGITGLIDAHHALIRKAGGQIPIVYAPNMSLGLALMSKITEQVAAMLDHSFNIEILEFHHRHKTDAPSGTALALGHAAAKGRRINLAPHACFDRTCRTIPRPQDEIGFAVLRGGSVAGDHKVFFSSDEEIFTLSHQALNREVFAKGALKAALWLEKKDPGVYSMQNVLNL